MYELSAVLIHRGISAYSGHYIAHVKDAHTGDWYKFNDEEIEKMEGKKLQLGLEEDIGKSQFFISMLDVQRLISPLLLALIPKLGLWEMWVVILVIVRKLTALSVLVAHPGLPAETVKSQTRKPKCTKGSHCSRNAYMLVYKVQEEQFSDSCRTSVEVPGEQRRHSLGPPNRLYSHLYVAVVFSFSSEVGGPRQPQI